MNAAAKALEQHATWHGKIGTFVFNAQWLWLMVLLTSVLGSAFAVVYERTNYRHYTDGFQTAQQSYQTLKVKQKQLQLEQATWATQSRIQTIAQQQGMHEPTHSQVIMVG